MKFFIIVITFVISMVLDQKLITTEARRLSKKDDKDHYKAGATDGFVSTSPGNSPGMGHKKGNANVEIFQYNLKPTEETRLQKTNGHDRHFKAGSTDDLSPTSRGNSPGIGHKKGNAKVERKLQNRNSKNYFKTGSTDDFAPTTPGNSPGIGHKKGSGNVKGFKDNLKPTEDRQMQKTKGQDHQFKTTVNRDDFAPTSPGNSPGMGHKKGDDFKPTTPGHSPGIGHAVKNNKPKV